MSIVLPGLTGDRDRRAGLRQVRVVRFGLPLCLLTVATTFEVWEHWREGERLVLDPVGMVEVFIFGIMGPLAVYLALTYMIQLTEALEQARADAVAANESLEQVVAARTAALRASLGDLDQANRRLLAMDQMKSDFVSLVSHELRAPLATLNGGLEVALEDASLLPAKAQRILRLLMRETDRLTLFVQALLDLSQLEAGKLRVTCGPVAVRPMLVRAVEVALGPESARIVWQLPADIPPVLADEVHIEQVVRNLLRNAIKYTPPGTPIELSVAIHAGTLGIYVSDHGRGIHTDEQARIFERFYRMDGQDERTASGWGLGLYFARALTEAQGGVLTVQSPVHADPAAPGSRFTIMLPIAEEVPDSGEASAD